LTSFQSWLVKTLGIKVSSRNPGKIFRYISGLVRQPKWDSES
jgi:hypothetical protein